MWYSYALIVLGIVAAANLIIAKVPSTKEYIAKLAPYQGWLGVAAFISGVYWLIWSVLHMGIVTEMKIFHIVLFYAAVGLLIALGALIGVGTAKPFIKNQQAQEKITALVGKLAPIQGILGIAGIVVGILLIVA